MMSNNKILTVSYGTFSCTLEGFDDSFGTMKAIAEYFRDLASDDRYFGAEPPQPDAEMLTRIAQKEVSRRVEVREHEGKLVLSAHDLAEPDPAPTPAMSTPQTNPQAEAMIAAEAVRAAQAKAEAAAETARIQAEAEAKAAAADVAILEEANQEAALLAAETEAAQQAQADRLAIEAAAVKTADVAPAPRDLAAEMPEAEAFFSDAGTETAVQAEVVEETPAPKAQDESIAAKLQRIRAVVSQADHASDDDDFSEDQHADDFEAEAEGTTETVASQVVTPTADADDFDISNFSVDTDDDVLSSADVQAQSDVQDTAISDILEASEIDDAAEIEVQADAETVDEDDMSAILARLAGDDVAAPATLVQDTPEQPVLEENLFDDTIYNADESELEDAVDAAVEPRRVARVIKVKRADLEAAIAQGNLEEVGSTLSETDEADLARDLAAAEADADAVDTLFEDATFEETTTPGIEALRSINDHEGDDLTRLMAEADQQMDEEEGKQSRDAFAHLRAAVVQKNADSGLATQTTEEEEGAYRTDLATAVKPRRPAAAAKTSRPTAVERPAPLKLVAEQRVTDDGPVQSTPIRPRRVAQPVVVENDVQEIDASGSFVEFAEEMGVTELPELIEAAAAYLSFVHGHDQFSRPQLMHQVRTVEKQSFNREDGLRSFGQLLRAGKIEKTKGGRFTVTNEISFRPDEREAG